MKIVVIDGQGGRMGRVLIEQLMERGIDKKAELIAVGTNGIATAAMMKAGAQFGATGENPVIVACRDADVIIGPIGIVVADSLLGEVTPAMALAIGQSRAKKLLLPVSRCNTVVVGVKALPMADLVRECVDQVMHMLPEDPVFL